MGSRQSRPVIEEEGAASSATALTTTAPSPPEPGIEAVAKQLRAIRDIAIAEQKKRDDETLDAMVETAAARLVVYLDTRYKAKMLAKAQKGEFLEDSVWPSDIGLGVLQNDMYMLLTSIIKRAAPQFPSLQFEVRCAEEWYIDVRVR